MKWGHLMFYFIIITLPTYKTIGQLLYLTKNMFIAYIKKNVDPNIFKVLNTIFNC